MTAHEKNRLDGLEEQQRQTDQKINRILYYLEDDPLTNTKGLVSRQQETNDKLDGILEREKVYKAKATVWGMVGAALFSGALWFVKFIITK
jgi:hypothetical protein